MFSRKALSAAIAGAIATGFSLSASAVTNLAAGYGAALTIAKPAISGTNKVVTNTGDAFSLSQLSNAFGTSLSPVYVKISVANATFNSALTTSNTSAGLAVADTITTAFASSATGIYRSVSFVSGGAVGDSSIVWKVDGADQADDFSFRMPDLRTTGSDVTVTVGIYSAPEASGTALKTFSPTSSTAAVNLLTLSNSALTNGAATNTLTAAVATSFKSFQSGGTTTNIGTFGDYSINIVSTQLAADASTAIASVATVASLTDSTITVAGDLSVGTWYFGPSTATCGTSSSVTGAVALTLNSAKTSGSTTLGSFIAGVGAGAPRPLCVQVPGTTAVPLNSGITVTLAPATLGSTYFGAATAPSAGTVGIVVRDGTTVQIPYATTFSDYAQRITIQNRGTADAPFTISFQTATGTTASTTGKLTGATVTGGNSATYLMSDFVSFTGSSTRGSATLVIDALDSNVSVSSTTVNSADKSTDTVLLNN